MKKIIYGLIFIFALMISSCSNNIKIKTPIEILQEADLFIKEEIFNSNIVDKDFTLPIILENEVQVNWISTNEDYLKIDFVSNEEAYFKIKRPDVNYPNKDVKLKYELAIEKDDKKEELLLKEIDLIIKANEIPEINNISDILNLLDNQYSPSLDEFLLNVEIKDALVMASSANEYYVYDQTGIIKVISDNHLTINKVYDLSGKIKWQRGRWEILLDSFHESLKELPSLSYNEVLDIENYLADTINVDFLNIINGNPEDGNIPYDYIKVVGTLSTLNGNLILKNNNSYFIIDENTIDYNDLFKYLNYEVIINAFVTKYESESNTFILVLNESGSNFKFGNLNEIQKLNLDFNSINIPTQISNSETLEFINKGFHDSSISWESSNPELINPESGEVNIPPMPQLVTLFVTLKNGSETLNKQIVVLLGELTLLNIENIKFEPLNSLIKFKGIFYGNLNDDFFVVGNSEGGILIEKNNYFTEDFNLGDELEITGKMDKINEVFVVRNYTLLNSKKSDLPSTLNFHDLNLDLEFLIKQQNMLVDANYLTIVEITKSNETSMVLKTFNDTEIKLSINNLDITNLNIGDIINLEKVVLSLLENEIILVYTEASKLTKIDGKTKETIDLFNNFNLKTTFDDYGELLLHKKIIDSKLIWEYIDNNNPNNDFINLSSGNVRVPETGSVNVGIKALISIGNESIKREFLIKLNARPALMYEFDFTNKSDVPNNVSNALRETDVTNKIDNNKYTFWREDATINERNSNLRGVVFNLAKSRQNKTSLLYTDFKMSSLKKIELKIGNWGLDATNNLDDIAKHINILVSTDKLNWEVVKDLKPEWVKTNDSLNTYTVNVPNDDDLSYYFKIEIVGSDDEYQANLRLILTNLKFYIKD